MLAVRGFKPETTQKNENFARRIRTQMVACGVSRAKLMRLTGRCTVTMTNRFGENNPKPDEMTVKELRIYCRVLKLSDEDILDFVRG